MHAANWFELPTHDLARATRFYAAVLATELTEDDSVGDVQMVMLPHGKSRVGGALVKCRHMQPEATGTLVYLNTPDLDAVLGRVEAAGGAILMPKTFLREDIGSIAIMRDTEGNSVGLHSRG
ncbi:VOC family protein [Chitinimonas sp. PSY-7]|uniref:VOC family protein n=1 Tax=Chitinimonas sp. PSY-7 TaxID=3459088 RepID=UPI00403FFC64